MMTKRTAAGEGRENTHVQAKLRVHECISPAVGGVTTEIGRSPRSYFSP